MKDSAWRSCIFSRYPGLYITANLYLPDRKIDKPLPTILYVCGHGGVKKDGVSFGNKTSYHHHGIWFAHDYACLIIDTLQLGEIEGEHHGTYNLNKWWWMARGYTSAGVEAWNCMRALDYLEDPPGSGCETVWCDRPQWWWRVFVVDRRTR